LRKKHEALLRSKVTADQRTKKRGKEMTRPQKTLIRTIMLVITLLNDLLIFYGKSPINIDESTVYQIITILSTIIVPIWTWWKNNSITKHAKKADEYLDRLKAGEE